MPVPGLNEILLALLSMGLVFCFWAMIVAWGWMIWRLLRGEPVLPERPLVSRDDPPWRAGTVFLVALSYLVVSLLILNSYPLVADVLPGSPPVPLAVAPLSHLMVLNALVDLVMLIVIPLLARFTCGARLQDFGLSFDGWWHQATVGVVATLIAAPPVNAIQILATRIWTPQPHPVQEMLLKEFSVGVAGLAVLTAVGLAPLFEELAFRGLVQSWLVALLNRRVAPIQLPSVAAIPSDAPRDELPQMPWRPSEPEAGQTNPYESPRSIDLPPLLDAPSTRREGLAWLGILLTSLLFAYVHAPQWPAPIALFLLAVVIGTVYYRTNSLIAAIFMHATFNGLSTLVLFLALLTGHTLEPKKLSKRDKPEQVKNVKLEKTPFVVVSGRYRPA